MTGVVPLDSGADLGAVPASAAVREAAAVSVARPAGEAVGSRRALRLAVRLPFGVVDQHREVELIFAPQEEGGFHVYAPDLPGLHTQGDTLEEAAANAGEALELYVEGLRDEGRSLDFGVVRRKFPLPA